MPSQLIVIGGGLVLALVAVPLAFILGWRRQSRLVLGLVVWFSKHVINPRQLRSAGTPGAYAGIVRHRGRVSGRSYETPVGVVATKDAYLVALPYGPRTSWLRNVIASGSATLVHEGATFDVDRPEVIPMAGVATHFSAADQGSFRLLRVDHCLRLRRAEGEPEIGVAGAAVEPQTREAMPNAA